jgi:alpha-amylase
MRHLNFLILILFTLLISSVSCKPGSSNPSVTPSPTPTPPQQQGTTYWWNDTIFYEIFVRSFYDSDGDGIGDIQGIIQKLDYLNDGDPNTDTDLGITGIWLMPINPSPSYHGYDVQDYLAIQPAYGTIADFRQLVTEAHNRGIAVIIDLVMNHSSSQHPWFIDSASSAGSAKRNWYKWSPNDPGQKGPWSQDVWHRHSNGDYYYGLFWSGMPDLNFDEPAVRTEIKEIANYWLTTMNVDGFRCDAVKYITEEDNVLENTDSTIAWWQEFQTYYKSINPQAITVGEAWDNTETVVRYTGDALDFCFEFDMATTILNAVQNGSPAVIIAKMEELIDSYPYHQYALFLSNHDQDRVFTRLGNAPDQAKLAASVYLTLPGIPFIYYGEEIGMSGQSPDPDRRKPMQWTNGLNAGFTTGTPWHTINNNYIEYNVNSEQENNDSIWNQYQKLIKLRSQQRALRQGTYHPIETNTSVVLAFMRQFENEAVVVVANFASSERTDIQLNAEVSNLQAGTYSVTDLISDASQGNLTIGINGKIENWIPINRVDARSTHILLLRQ